MMSELKLCPFCNDSKYLSSFLGELSGRMKCDNCGAVGPYTSFEDDWTIEEMNEAVATAWNQRADDWQPIETAPKDQRIILWNEGSIYYNCHSRDNIICSIENNYESPECDLNCRSCKYSNPAWVDFQGYVIVNPTHWKPTPEGPK